MSEPLSGFNYNAIVEALGQQEEVNDILDYKKDVVDQSYWESLEKSCITKGKMDYLQSSADFSIAMMYNKVQTKSYLDQQHNQFDKKTEAMKKELEDLNLNMKNLVDDFINKENEMSEKLKNLSINFQYENMVQESENLALSIDYKKNEIKEAKIKLLILQNKESEGLDQEGIHNIKELTKECFQKSLKYGNSNKIAARLAEVEKNTQYLLKKINILKDKIHKVN